MILVVVGAGFVGGLVNALLESEGLVLPKIQTLAQGGRIWRPGFVGNVLVGGITAFVLAAFYSPIGAKSLLAVVDFDMRALAGAVLSGVGGARLLTQEVNRRYNDAVRNLTTTAFENLTKSNLGNRE